MKLGTLTAFSAGMVNVISVILFFAFTSNVTGYYAILAQEISKGNWYQAAVVLLWVGVFFLGNFTSNMIIIHRPKRMSRYLAHAIPVFLEIICMITVGFYLEYFYQNSLQETEFLVGLMLFAMGLQNGLTASISNFSIKTTHLTGLTTDLGILVSMFTLKKFRKDKKLIERAQLLIAIMMAYLVGGVISGLLYYNIQNHTFYLVSIVLLLIVAYDFYKAKLAGILLRKQPVFRKYVFQNNFSAEENSKAS